MPPWPATEADAVAVQHALAGRIDVRSPAPPIHTVAGCDIAYATDSDELFAAAVIVEVPSLAVVERSVVRSTAVFPYVPGLLSFREVPPLLDAIGRLRRLPDAVMVDGQGVAHPRRFGLACHLGLLLDRPAVGCAKSWLVGTYTDPGPDAGDHSPLIMDDEVVGAAVRSAAGAKTVFVSPGHRIDAAGAVELVRRTLSGYRHPTPTRLAHLLSNEARAAGRVE